MSPAIGLRCGLFMLLLEAASLAFGQVVIDGDLRDSLWNRAAPEKLTPTKPGVPVQDGGKIKAILNGKYLYLGARLPEPSGHFTARSIGKNPRWEEEDRLTFVIRVTSENDWKLVVGPLGAFSVMWRWTGESDWYTSRPEQSSRFLVSASASGKEWRVEAAIPLSALGSPRSGAVHVSSARVRAARPGTPEEHWQWPADRPMAEVAGRAGSDPGSPDPLFQPLLPANAEPALEVGRRKILPPLESGWNDDAWRDVPVWDLLRNEAGARTPVFATEVRMMQDGHKLAVMARCEEPDRIVARVQERDGAIDGDDSFQVYIATSGSAYVKFAVNPLGMVQDASGFSGGPRISRPHVDWNSPVRAAAHALRGEWIARLDLPLDFLAETLGEAGTPRDWRILLMRHRPGRSGEPQETSVLPVTQTPTPYCPARYRRLALVDADAAKVWGRPLREASSILEFAAPNRVLSAGQRQQMALSGMLDRNIRNRTQKILEAERQAWDRVRTLDDWKRFRDPKWKALAASIGEFPERRSLETKVMKEFRGDGYRRQDLVYQTRPGFWVTANLYLPVEPPGRMPGIVIAHSLHSAKTQFELQDMGILWARAGCAVLILDQVGYGERMEGYPWSREAYHSRYIEGMQLYLVGESLIKWMVWDILRGIDLLLERKDMDEKRIILLGSVAGGGDPAAVAAALDKRIAAVAPFNFGESTPEIPRFLPEKNQWPRELADPGLSDWETPRCLRRGIIDQFLQWTVCAMTAPRRFIYSYELGWNVEDLPAWGRYQKVFGLYQAHDHLAEAHGFGPFPGPGECWHIGPAQRRSLYPTLERWFGIPIPFAAMGTSVNANLSPEPDDRRPETELAVLTPATAAPLRMRTAHELAREIGRAKVESARAALARMDERHRQQWMRAELARRLGDIEPNPNRPATVHWSKKLPAATVEGITIAVETDITVPLLLFRPATKVSARTPVVVGIAEGGKALFVKNRGREIESLLKQGVAVCLPDVRGTGETSPDSRRDPDNDENMQAVNEQMLGETLVGRRLKDLRTVLVYLAERPDLDGKRIGLWGESLMPANAGSLIWDENPLWQVGPQIQQQGEPLGGLLALLGALYDPHVRAIAVRGGLAGYSSILDDAFAYVSADVTIPGFLEAGDLADVAAVLAPKPILLEDLVDGKNRRIPEDQLQRELQPLVGAYRNALANLSIRTGPSKIAGWLVEHL